MIQLIVVEGVMSALTRYRVHQDSATKEYDLELYRNFGFGDKDNWVKVDQLSGLSAQELKEVADYIYSLIKKKA